MLPSQSGRNSTPVLPRQQGDGTHSAGTTPGEVGREGGGTHSTFPAPSLKELMTKQTYSTARAARPDPRLTIPRNLRNSLEPHMGSMMRASIRMPTALNTACRGGGKLPTAKSFPQN